MEKFVELNHSLLSKLPLGVQSLLKSMPLSDYSLLLIAAAVGILAFSCLFCSSKEKEYVPVEEYSMPVEIKEKTVKVKIPNTKKNRRGGKKKSEQVVEEVKEEAKENTTIEDHGDSGWEQVKVRKPKKNN